MGLQAELEQQGLEDPQEQPEVQREVQREV